MGTGTRTAIEDIRALLWQFRKAGLKDFHWKHGDFRLFIARKDGCANPMFSPAPEPEAEPGTMAGISAPHLGLFEPCCAVGDTIGAGSVVARIDVLGRKTEVVARESGRVLSLGFGANDLVEYGDRLVELAAA